MKVFLDSIGCRLNQGEIECMARQFRQAGHELVATPEASDLVVINSCSVTAAAASDSRAHVRRAHRLNPHAGIVLTGCWSSVEPDEAAQLPGVIHVIPNPSKDSLVPDLLGLPASTLKHEPRMREPIPGKRMRTRAFIKIQDGCDNRCTFCLTTIARGNARSLPLGRVIEEINHAVIGGAQEAVLTGVQLSAYGRDIDAGLDLFELVLKVLSDTDVARVRLSSLEPWSLPHRFFELWQNPRLCRHLHLPLQSGCSATLRRMGRPITPAAYAEIVDSARASIADLALTTDLIAGFPGETDEEFSQNIAFVSKMAFSNAHVFTYSPRPGTAAARIRDQVPSKVARQRSSELREEVARSQHGFLENQLGKRLDVLWERTKPTGGGAWEHVGLSDNYLRVQALAPTDLHNRVSQVIPETIHENTLHGSISEFH